MEVFLVYLSLTLFAFGPAVAIYCQKDGYALGPSKYCFKTFDAYKTFPNAQRRCVQDGASLAKSDDDYQFVRNEMKTMRNAPKTGDYLSGLWVGARRDKAHIFRWLDNTRVDPPSGKNVHWQSGEPNDFWWREDCMMTFIGWRAWNDIRCDMTLRFICQMGSVDPCKNSPCKNNGVCSSKGRTVTCACPAGYSGGRCERDDRPCTKGPCQNGGECRNILIGKNFAAKCLCPKLYEGYYCEKKIDPCAKVNCSNRGECVANGLQWKCNCRKGFVGSVCETALKPCEMQPCQNGGICENVGDSFTCSCKPGYEGKTCEKEDGCLKKGVPCLNGGQCVENPFTTPVPKKLIWYCAVKIDGEIAAKTKDLTTAQKSLGIGNSQNRQAIIPMADQQAGDPHTLSKSWKGGSMWWGGWNDIHQMQAFCAKEIPPTQSLCQGEINYARGGRATASSVYGNTTTAAAAFVGHGQAWHEWHSKDGMPQWLQYELVEPVALCRISFLPRLSDSAGNVKRDCPKSYKFQGSNDGTTFETLLFVENQDECVSGVNISKSFNNINAYKFYRFLVLEVPGRTTGRNYAVMGELRFFGNDDLNGYHHGPDGFLYKYHKNKKSWTAAKETCNNEGGHLVMEYRKATHDYIISKWDQRFWIGVYDKDGKGDFTFVDGSNLVDTYWATGEPNLLGKERCGEMNYPGHPHGRWNNIPCSGSLEFLCQKAGRELGDATCACPRGYLGAGCEEGPCHVNPCRNGGVCQELNGDYFCDCTPQFSGRHCAKECPAKSKDGFPEKLDIMFLLDGSASVGTRDFKTSLGFVDMVIQKVKLGADLGRVGYVQFGGKYRRDRRGRIYFYDQIKKSSEIRFADSVKMTKQSLRQKISRDNLFTYFTRTGDALRYVLWRFKNEARMGEPDVAKYLMVLTDGKSSGQTRTIKQVSDLLWQMNITSFAIGVGNSVSNKELDFIAHGQKHLTFPVDNFAKLNDQFLQKVLSRQCYTGPCEKYQPCRNNGTCIEYDDQYSCQCPVGKFTGVHCEIDCKDRQTGGLPDQLDAFFLMDGSGSIEEFDEFLNTKHLVSQILLKMDIAPNKQRAAVIQFAGQRDQNGEWKACSDKEIGLRNSTEMGKLKLIDYVEKEDKWNGWTLTGEALERVADMVESDGRPSVAKYAFVLTDGRVTWHVEKMKEAVKRLHKLGVTTIAIAIGGDIDDDSLAIIAGGEKNNIFKEANFRATSDKVISQVVEKRCEVWVGAKR